MKTDHLKRFLSRRLPQIGVVAWAAFWAWFVVADGLHHYWGEGERRDVGVVGVALAILGTLVTSSWAWPRLGSVLLIGFGGFALWFFPGAMAVLLLALPPLALGGVIQSQSPSRGEQRLAGPMDDRA